MTTAVSTLERRPQAKRATSDYAELLNQVREAGLLRRRHSYYIVKIAGTVGAFALAWVAFAMIGDSWYQLIVAGALGILFTQLAFLGHEAAHRQIFRSGKVNDWFGIVFANLFVGLSYGWWMNKHSRHHANPNKIGKDPDIEDLVIAFTPEQAKQRSGLAARLTGKQGYFFFPLLLLEGINLHKDALITAFTGDTVKQRRLEITFLAVRLISVTAIPFVFLSPGLAFAFLGVHLAVFGLYMGASFAPNHKGMPLLEARDNVNFLQRQVLTSRNIHSNWFNNWLMGGLNFQVEHHLFPSMPRPNLVATQKIVKAFCEQRDVRYTEVSLLQSYAAVVRYLNRVGLGERDPFECPMIASLRPRS
ncbi:acyl-CoA desaturase [Saxibacter everestensis]|uniref:Acyl-CoA desaturase n=1 Tax=Saxibacter everestensis TaxID=2909229 RepID=A0ABY8QR85_9MICO|nr:acyl-CoA desaturase [Brevibacteriaceae bacterium ZFBP1038]